MFWVISQLYKHLGKKPRGAYKSPVHADFEKVLNFIPGTKTQCDITQIDICFQNKSFI